MFYLFDLDGTIVNTDRVYVQVWRDILARFDLNVDDDFFAHFIKGKSDKDFLQFIMPNITMECLQEISNMKDDLFIEYLQQTTSTEIFVDDYIPFFFDTIRHEKIAIVTNSNRKSASFILEYTRLHEYVDVLIASEDCVTHKPNAEPYLNAMISLHAEPNECVVFEDTITGYNSAQNAKVKMIYFLSNDDNFYGDNVIKFSQYNEICLDTISTCHKFMENKYCSLIKAVLDNEPIVNISQCRNAFKTGFICDILMYKLTYKYGDNINVVCKLQKKQPNILSETAKNLDLYNKEAFFYKKLAPHICAHINIPKCYGVMLDLDNIGIVMENLNDKKGVFNIPLHTNISMLLKVVSDIQTLHCMYYFESPSSRYGDFQSLTTIKANSYMQILVEERFDDFMRRNRIFIDAHIFSNIFKNFKWCIGQASTYPLSFCHGDVKSANIFYENNTKPYFLDWQYIGLNKGVSDIAFLLVESVPFDQLLVDTVLKYYYKRTVEFGIEYAYDQYMHDFKVALCVFPFVVCVWFNTENPGDLLDTVFPMRFMRNLNTYLVYFEVMDLYKNISMN
jgi:beta-phosphoglucomutase